jgi:hypothetical protein
MFTPKKIIRIDRRRFPVPPDTTATLSSQKRIFVWFSTFHPKKTVTYRGGRNAYVRKGPALKVSIKVQRSSTSFT